jgi:thiamine kinase-like enzyme
LNQALYSNGFDRGIKDGIQVPEPVGCLPEFQMWLQQGVDGTDLFEHLTGQHGLAYAHRVAEAAFKLHNSHVHVNRTHSLQDELVILERQLLQVAHSQQHWRDQIQNIIAACYSLQETAPLAKFTGIHRDFYHDQLLINEDKLYLLDLDLYCLGDPALDIGNFVAHIEEQCLRVFGNPSAFDTITEAIINRYCQLAKHNLRDAIAMYTTLSIARHIAISQRIRERNRFTNSIISLCETRLNTKKGYLHAV